MKLFRNGYAEEDGIIFDAIFQNGNLGGLGVQSSGRFSFGPVSIHEVEVRHPFNGCTFFENGNRVRANEARGYNERTTGRTRHPNLGEEIVDIGEIQDVVRSDNRVTLVGDRHTLTIAAYPTHYGLDIQAILNGSHFYLD